MDGPSTRAPETSMERGNFSPKRKTGCRGRPFGSFWGPKTDSPEGAKQKVSSHTEAAQKHPNESVADKVRSYEEPTPHIYYQMSNPPLPWVHSEQERALPKIAP